MTSTQRFAHHDSTVRRMLQPSWLFFCLLPLLLAAGANAVPLTYNLSGVVLSDGATASGSFSYDAATNTYGNINITTTNNGVRPGATYNSVSSGFAPDSGGVLLVTIAGGSQAGLPGVSLLFSPVLTGVGGKAKLTGEEGDCADAGCTVPTGTIRSFSAGSVSAASSSAPLKWFLSGVKFTDGSSASGSFVFDGGTSTFSNINITGPMALYNTLSGGIPADSTGALFVSSTAANQTGLPGLSMFFTLPTAGGTSAVTGQESTCADPPCSMPTTTTRLINAGTVTTVGLLSISKTHAGAFVQGDVGDTYTVTVSNAPGAAPTSGLVAVIEAPPTGLTVTSMSGVGWTCATLSCTRSDALSAGSSYSPIAVTVNVAQNAPGSLTNQVTVSGGGAASSSASDSTTVVPPSPFLTIAKTHAGNFSQLQVGAQYSITVSNTGVGLAAGLVTMTEAPPTGLTVTSMSGTGWTCNTVTCTRNDALPGGTSYPVITVLVNVSGTAGSPLVNQASISFGGSASASVIDVTNIGPPRPALSVNRKVLNFGISGSLITSPQTVLVTLTTLSNVAWTATSSTSNITATPSSGVGTGTFQVSAVLGVNGTITVAAAGAINSPQVIQVNVTSVVPTVPFGNIDTPINGTANIAGAIPVTGWALDNIEVTRVDIFRERVAGETTTGLAFIGTATFSVDSRPDVAASSPLSPFQYRGGWGYQLLTNALPNAAGSGAPGNGTYVLHAIAFDKAGLNRDLGSKTITVDNADATKPFGTIDTPTQGGTISGTDSVNFGWALTPQPGMIPIDGSSMLVVIDGVFVGHPTYNQPRSDIATLFPGYANSNGAIGFFHVNTTGLANGVHTISWSVFDNLGRGEGLGSRYFNVLNGSGSVGIAAPQDSIEQPAASEGVRVRHGLNRDRSTEPVVKNADGGYSVRMEEVGLIELHLGAAGGNMLIEGEPQALPTGSTLKGGVFYWQPGPGFVGEYTMQFTRPDGTTIPVRVKIVPKRF
jgi:Domain of unknown function DUF11